MKRFYLVLVFLFSFSSAQAELNVFACEPEWGALAQEIGGKKVSVYNATHGLQDPHHIEARPSLIAKARKADLLVCTGAELEIGWLPLLLKKSGNAKIQQGTLGHLMATDYVQLLDIPEKVDRSMGHVHAGGNPHIQLDPRRIAKVAKALLSRLSQIDPKNARHYQQRYSNFNQRWAKALKKWNELSKNLRGKAIVVHHKNWVYLRDWLGLRSVAMLEPKPGIPPNSSHLSRLVSTLKNTPAEFVIYASYQNPRAAKWLTNKSGIRNTKLPSTIGGTKQAKDLFSFFDDVINRLLQVSKNT